MRLIDADVCEEEMLYVMCGTGYQTKAMYVVRHAETVDAVPVVRCKDCKHFELDHWENVNGIPLIVAHEVCIKWSGGCKTLSDGYCFMAERKEE